MSSASEITTLEVMGYQVNTAFKRVPNSPHPPLLIFNGVGCDLQMLQPVWQDYEHSDLISFDIPEASGLQSTTRLWRMSNYARLADALLQQLGVEKVNVLGYSWGGALAQQFVRSYPKRCNKLMLAATSPGHTMVPGRIFASTKVLDPRLYLSPQRLFALIFQAYPNAQRLSHLQNYRGLSAKVYVNQIMALVGWSSLLWLPFVRHPTRIIHAADDVLVSPCNAKIMAALMPNAELSIYESGGHMFVFSHFERFVQDLTQFIEQ